MIFSEVCAPLSRSVKNNKRAFGSFVVFAVLFSLYVMLAWLARGGDVWWYVDFVSGGNVFWADDAYRFFLARQAFSNPETWFFNFVLPLALMLDSVLVFFSGYDQFLARVLKAGFLALSWWLSYQACLRVSAPRFALIGSLLVYTLPLLIYIGVSFYAESWFIFLVSAATYCWVSERRYSALLLVSLLPLIRFEGFYAVLAFSLYALYLRDYRSFLLPYIVGTLYFLLILVAGPGVFGFLSWRAEMAEVYLSTGRWYGGDMGRFWAVISIFLLPAAILGLWARRSLRVLLLAFLFVTGVIVGVGLAGLSNLEPRYLLMGLAFLPPGVAVFLGSVSAWLHSISLGKLATPSLIVLVAMMACFNFNSVHVVSELRQYVTSNGSLPNSVRSEPLALKTYFRNMPAEEVLSYHTLANRVHAALVEHREIKTVIVSNFALFYFLDPGLIPDDVTVAYPPFGRKSLQPILGPSLSAAYFPKPPYFSYFSLQPAEAGRDLILYVDTVPLPDYPFRWIINGNELAIFSGSMVPKDQVEKWRERPFGAPDE
ncbi:hypothetical protein [Alcanivorax sp. 1008]|uniref:hypothetical protein n=1 Tax=Alcanivorax sp. 1008 TaxID=2816853 RepID=UPI001D940634|nr:hypothetical protein [Alcanivorax sp. 1008]MCC1498057.1 hypothetical protein [Alcanivorax sp. 1008]